MAVARRLAVAAVLLLLIPVADAQFAERNVNMVSGTTHPGGDPFLRQQNEPSVAVSTRNPLHLLAAANDYRSVDIKFNAPPRPDQEETGDAWIGIFKSVDGGNRWWSTLLDGYPQLTNSTSPIHGFQAAADPVVRAGNGGMFYVTGIVLNRGANPLGGVFVARLIDNNNSEVGDPIVYLDTKMIQQGSSGQFIDKPWFGIDPKPNGLQCNVAGQSFPAQNLYLAYTVFVGGDNNIRTKMMFTRSQDCGATWSSAVKLSETFPINQGAIIGASSSSNNVYVAWRQFASGNDPNAIVFAKSIDGGKTFPKATIITNITPFEQGTGMASIRTNAYPAMAVDDSGRIYIAWSQRNADGDGRLVMINSTDGVSWTAPVPVNTPAGRGHQFMPAMTFASGKLTMAWYDVRLDHTIGTYTPNALGYYNESRTAVGNLALVQPSVVFWNFIADISPDPNIALVRRHTLEVYSADSNGGLMPTFNFAKISRYKFGSWGGSSVIQDLQINPPNLPMFRQGTVPFFGDYIDIAAYVAGGASSQSAPQAVAETTSSVPSRVRHVVWTDNRDVRPPLGTPPDWTKYTPVNSAALGGTSKFDQSQQTIPCADPINDATGSRNQNIYTTRVTDGLFAGSPGNAKPLGTIMRAFTVFVQNARDTLASYRLTILQQPAGGSASFLQFGPTMSSIDVSVPPHSTATRTVFVTGAPHARVDVSVVEITAPGGLEVPGGLSSSVGFNTDPHNPDIGNPDIGNPDIGNQEVFNPDIGNPDIGNPDIGNPDIGNPDIGNPDIGNPDIGNPDIGNPDIGNPDIGNPDIGNPDIGNPDIGNGSVTDTTWDAENGGNTTGGYTVNLFQSSPLPPNITKSQLILHKLYDTPIARDCNLGVEHHRQIVASINNPDFTTIISDASDPSLTDPSEKNATLWLAPHEKGYITVRLIDPVNQGLTLDASQYVTPIIVAQSANTGSTTPSVALTITPGRIPDATIGGEFGYNFTLQAIGGIGNKTFSGGTGLPPGMSLSSNGLVSGLPQATGAFPFTVTVTDSAVPPNSKITTIQFNVVSPLFIITDSLPSGAVGVLYSATLTRSGGVAPFNWSLVDSSLPAGLSLSNGGVITGTPTTPGSTGFTVQVTDSTFPNPQSRTRQFSIQILGQMFLSFLEQPNSAVEGATNRRFQVLAQDAAGAVLPGVQITLNLGSSPCGETRADQTALTSADGIALFPAQVTPNACYGYTFRATGASPNYSPAVKDTDLFDSFGFGNFQPTLVNHREGHTATRLNDGRILVTGGTNGDSPIDSAEVFDLQSNAWISLPSMNAARQFHSATLMADGRVMIAGGRATSGELASIEFFDPATNTFSANPNSLGTGREQHSATRLPNGSVAIIGGFNSGPLGSIELVAPDGTVTPVGSGLAQARYGHSATLLANGRIVIVGGGFTSIEIFDGSTVSGGGDANEGRLGHTATLLSDGKIFIAGGNIATPDGEITSQTAEIYDPATAVSTSAGSMRSAHFGHAAQRLGDGTVIIAAGAATFAPGQAITVDSVELYDPATNTFIDYGTVSIPDLLPTIVPYDGLPGGLLLIGGFDALKHVDLFYPPR